MPRRSIQRMRDKIELGFYAVTRHAEEEMHDDSLTTVYALIEPNESEA